MSKSEDDETVDRTETVETAGKEGADGDAPSDQLETASMNPGAGGMRRLIPQPKRRSLNAIAIAVGPAVRKRRLSGGLAELEVHHADRDPDDVGEHDLANLLTLCRSCHSWHHKRGKSSDVPIRLTAADDKELLSHDYEILRILNDNGPLRTGAIAERLTAEMSLMAVRERLWHLGGLDNKVLSEQSRS